MYSFTKVVTFLVACSFSASIGCRGDEARPDAQAPPDIRAGVDAGDVLGDLGSETPEKAMDPPPHEWVRATGTDCQARAVEAVPDSSGDVIEAGFFQSQASNTDVTLTETPFEPGQPPRLRNDTYLFKYKPDATFQWALQSSGNYLRDEPNGVAIDAQRNIYVAGMFMGPRLAFGRVEVNVPDHHGTKAYLLKVSPDGTPLWLRSFHAPFQEGDFLGWGIWLHEIMVSPDGHLVITGSINRDVASIGGHVVKNNGIIGTHNDIFVAKLTTEGEVKWVTQAVSMNGLEIPGQLNLDKAGHIYLCGHTISETLSIGPVTLPAVLRGGSNEAFVFKLAPDGTPLWGDRFGSSDQAMPTEAHAVAIDADGAIYVGGEFRTTQLVFGAHKLANNNQQRIARGSRDLFVAKYSARGDKLWLRGSTHAANFDYSETIHRLEVGSDNKLFVVGTFNGQSMTLDGVTVTNSVPRETFPYDRTDPFVAKLTPSGRLLWVRTLHTVANRNIYDETITRFRLDKDNRLHGAGFLLTLPDGFQVDAKTYFHPLPGPNRCSDSRDAFIIKFRRTFDP